MAEDSIMHLVGLIIGLVLLGLAFVSTVSKVTLSVFNPRLGRQIRYREHPRQFTAVVFLYWLIGMAAVVIALVRAVWS